MIKAIVVIGKRNPKTYIVKAEDWLNPEMYMIDGQESYTGDTDPIIKAEYKIGWLIETASPVYSF